MCCTWLAGKAGPKKIAKNWSSGHHYTTLSGYIFATKAYIDNRKKLVKQQYLPHTSLQYGELRSTSGWDQFRSLGHPSKFQPVLHLSSVTAQHYSNGRQPNFAALNRGRHLYSAGRPSRWALADILVASCTSCVMWNSDALSKWYWLVFSDVICCWSLRRCIEWFGLHVIQLVMSTYLSSSFQRLPLRPPVDPGSWRFSLCGSGLILNGKLSQWLTSMAYPWH